jgi:hypothetical protein
VNGFRAFWISLSLCFIAASLSAETVLAVHQDHPCTGADCPVCLLIQRTENSFRQFKNVVFFSGFQGAAFLMTALVLKRAIFLFLPLSAVRLKVKINR